MKQIVTKGIVLTRTNYGEADRILTLLTPDQGKVRLMAKGVRKIKSKLAGGIELFSVSLITFIPGRGEIGTLISSRLETHFGNIAGDYGRTMLGYELLKLMNRLTEDGAGAEYFDLLKTALTSLNETELSKDRLELWFNMQLLKTTGRAPNLQEDSSGQKLQADSKYNFDYDSMAFSPAQNGQIGADTIKLLRLSYSAKSPKLLTQIEGTEKLIPRCLELTRSMLQAGR